MATSSWSGLSGKNNEIWDALWDEHVPAMGIAPTVGGEILRAMSRILYRFYNDGDMVGNGYGNETCNSSDRYLSDAVPDYQSLDRFNGAQEKEYEEAMLKNHRIVFGYIQKNPDLFQKNNTEDSSETSEEDYRRSREDEVGGWWDDPDEI